MIHNNHKSGDVSAIVSVVPETPLWRENAETVHTHKVKHTNLSAYNNAPWYQRVDYKSEFPRDLPANDLI